MLRKASLVLLVALFATLSGCEKPGDGIAAHDIGALPDANVSESLMRLAPAQFAAQKQRNPYMAYEHHVSVEVDESDLEASFQNTLNKCADDTEHACEILYSNLNTGDYPSGDLRMRVKKDGVAVLIETAAEGNEITQQHLSGEDLATPIFDNEKRLKMLDGYQKKLFELENKAETDIESLIKVSSEIARVQSEMEAAKGESEYLLKRVNMDIVSIRFHTNPKDSVLTPIGDALESFIYNLSDGVGNVITIVAYMIPWIITLVALFFILRWIWKGRKGKKSMLQ